MFKKQISLIVIFLACSFPLMAEQSNPKVNMQTNLGEITIELFPTQSPKTVENFLKYVDEGFYKGIIFHRTIAGFMIQGGGYTQDMKLKSPKGAVVNESKNGLSNLRGTIAMARTNHPHSATSQFFINTVNNRNLDARGNQFGYTVFGRVTKGMDLVMQISRTPTAPQGQHRNVPKKPVIIKKVSRLETTVSTTSND